MKRRDDSISALFTWSLLQQTKDLRLISRKIVSNGVLDVETCLPGLENDESEV